MQCAANLFDGDGDEIEFYYYWNLDGVPVFDTNTVISTEVGDTHQCCVNATDGFIQRSNVPMFLSSKSASRSICWFDTRGNTTDDDVSVVLDYVNMTKAIVLMYLMSKRWIRTNGDREVDEDSDTLSVLYSWPRDLCQCDFGRWI